MSAPEFSNPDTIAAPLGPYTHIARVKAGSDLVYISGQVGVRPDGVLPESFEAQAEETYANLIRALTAEGMSVANLVKINSYVVMGQSTARARAIRLAAFGDARPASTFIYVPQLVEPKYLIEVEAVAAR